ncbi:dnaJ-like protein subfamily B member 9-like isoform X3 [Hibiscus syriacus]|uniref:DnaJ-like protein subfamily B member 9-like isoform X3 n=1 Tax=Hibiscus syriacus TaxID=106335 RepID=A0A6A2ZYF7_HIBSY|nr:dnaJ-like protein subfamily B member 9-like isoform X3 [Hibiscus syriacus]
MNTHGLYRSLTPNALIFSPFFSPRSFLTVQKQANLSIPISGIAKAVALALLQDRLHNFFLDEIKRAYRKLALKCHPDVNKEANAQEKFMRIKHAYNTLLNSESRRRYSPCRGGNRTSDFSYSGTQRSQSSNTQDEEFYGFGNFLRDVQITLEDFFRDLQEEFRNWEASASQEKPKSLWEELAAIGEEFVEFLEKDLNVSDDEAEENSRNDCSNLEKTGSGFQNEANKYVHLNHRTLLQDEGHLIIGEDLCLVHFADHHFLLRVDFLLLTVIFLLSPVHLKHAKVVESSPMRKRRELTAHDVANFTNVAMEGLIILATVWIRFLKEATNAELSKWKIENVKGLRVMKLLKMKLRTWRETKRMRKEEKRSRKGEKRRRRVTEERTACSIA